MNETTQAARESVSELYTLKPSVLSNLKAQATEYNLPIEDYIPAIQAEIYNMAEANKEHSAVLFGTGYKVKITLNRTWPGMVVLALLPIWKDEEVFAF